MQMSNIGTVLREEISRLARKEVRSQVGPTKKTTTTHRHEIVALKRQVASLERQVTLLLRKNTGARPEVSPEANAKPIRFSAKRLQSQRSRLGLSAIDFGRLLGVSAQTIYNWEHEVARPRTEQLGKLAALRGIGKREAGERLKQLAAASGKPPSKL
jgi:DNA-binding transcriptional regulator YiaG